MCKCQDLFLQDSANHIATWSTDIEIKLNESKSNEIVICFMKNAPPLEPIVINEKAIERVSKAKFTGVIISNDLTWNGHIRHIYTKV